MDIEKLIEALRQHGVACVRAYGRYCSICDEAATALSTLQAENEKLRAEVNRLEYERDYPCIYFKAGGLCRYGGDESEANICVMGPCEVETTAEDVDRLRAELEQVHEDNKKLCGAMMTVRRKECPELLSVVYELSYDAILSHEEIQNIARIVFDGLMREDLRLRGQKED